MSGCECKPDAKRERDRSKRQAEGAAIEKRRQDSKMPIILTKKAEEKVKEIMSDQPEPYAGLRIQVVGGGCSGFQYRMGFDKNFNDQSDAIFEFDGLKVFVDKSSLLYMEGAEVDYVEGLHGAGFKFNNPNSTGSCGCGSSFSV
jgi:iron-sulfur cluster assembly accessory protein